MLGAPGSFTFNANAHQPGPQALLGKTYEASGVAQGEAALADIARHPSTAKFIAGKFARHQRAAERVRPENRRADIFERGQQLEKRARNRDLMNAFESHHDDSGLNALHFATGTE